MTTFRSDFSEIKRATKRATHFAGPYSPCPEILGDWSAIIEPYAFPFVENLILMREYRSMGQRDRKRCLHDGRWTYIDQLFWLDAFARGINRYIDANQIRSDRRFIPVLRFFQQEVFFDPILL